MMPAVFVSNLAYKKEGNQKSGTSKLSNNNSAG
jgi:hypothetical protein